MIILQPSNKDPFYIIIPKPWIIMVCRCCLDRPRWWIFLFFSYWCSLYVWWILHFIGLCNSILRRISVEQKSSVLKILILCRFMWTCFFSISIIQWLLNVIYLFMIPIFRFLLYYCTSGSSLPLNFIRGFPMLKFNTLEFMLYLISPSYNIFLM